MTPPRKPTDAELAPADHVPAKKAATKQAAPKKVAAKNLAARKAPAERVGAARKVPATKVPPKKVAPVKTAAPVKKGAPAEKAPARKAAARKVAPATTAASVPVPVDPPPPPDDGWSDVWEQDDPQVPGWEHHEPPHEVELDGDEADEDFGPDEHDFDDDGFDEGDHEPGFGASSPLDDPRVQAGLDRIQRAAHEFIAGSRALLDVAEELVEDPRAAGGLASMLGELGHVATRLARNAARSGFGGPWSGAGPGGHADDDDPDDDPPVQRIPVS